MTAKAKKIRAAIVRATSDENIEVRSLAKAFLKMEGVTKVNWNLTETYLKMVEKRGAEFAAAAPVIRTYLEA